MPVRADTKHLFLESRGSSPVQQGMCQGLEAPPLSIKTLKPSAKQANSCWYSSHRRAGSTPIFPAEILIHRDGKSREEKKEVRKSKTERIKNQNPNKTSLSSGLPAIVYCLRSCEGCKEKEVNPMAYDFQTLRSFSPHACLS